MMIRRSLRLRRFLRTGDASRCGGCHCGSDKFSPRDIEIRLFSHSFPFQINYLQRAVTSTLGASIATI
jgi:hypothetical protein